MHLSHNMRKPVFSICSQRHCCPLTKLHAKKKRLSTKPVKNHHLDPAILVEAKFTFRLKQNTCMCLVPTPLQTLMFYAPPKTSFGLKHPQNNNNKQWTWALLKLYFIPYMLNKGQIRCLAKLPTYQLNFCNVLGTA